MVAIARRSPLLARRARRLSELALIGELGHPELLRRASSRTGSACGTVLSRTCGGAAIRKPPGRFRFQVRAYAPSTPVKDSDAKNATNPKPAGILTTRAIAVWWCKGRRRSTLTSTTSCGYTTGEACPMALG